jgi:hypothetical protein
MIVVHHPYNKCTTPLHMGWAPHTVGPTHVKECCTFVIHLVYRNHFPIYIYIYIYKRKKKRKKKNMVIERMVDICHEIVVVVS